MSLPSNRTTQDRANPPSPLDHATTTDPMPDLPTVPRKINAACLDAAMGRGAYVYADIDGEKRRIVAARRRGGVLQVKVLTEERRLWYPAAGAYTD